MGTSVLENKTVICRHCGSTNTFVESDGVGSQQRYEVVCLCGWRAELRTGLPGDASNWIGGSSHFGRKIAHPPAGTSKR